MRSLLAVLLALAALSVHAADRYVRQGATGSGTGADWTNAYTSLPASLGRGDTYYIADGSYGSYTFDDNASGTTLITIRKATVANHGTSTGWSDAFGDGQAVFGDLTFTRPYYTIDGVNRNESNWKDHAAYGIQATSIFASRLSGGHSPSTECSADNLTFRYLHVGVETTSYATRMDGRSFYLGGFGGGAMACQNWTIHRVLIQNTNELQCAGGEGLIVEYTYFYIGWSKEAIRGQVHCKNVIVRYSVFQDSCQLDPGDPTTGCTAEIGAWDGAAGSMDGWQVYGNVFYKTTSEVNSQAVIFIGDIFGPGPVTNNTVVYNNTIAGFKNWNADIELYGGSGNSCHNNLWYGNTGSATGCNATGTNNRVASSNPFVNYAGGDFRLIEPQTPGTTLSAPYNVDMIGAIRGASGWDIGAFEFGAGGQVALPAPANLRMLP